MDSKKQNLTPELKQIYDRVMNTQVEAKPATGTAPTPQTPPPPAAAPITTTPPLNTATTTPEAPKSAMKITPPAGGVQAPGAATMNTDKPFVFSGNKVTTPQGTTSVKVEGSKGVSGVVIAGLVVVLLVVWGVFWAKLLGLF